MTSQGLSSAGACASLALAFLGAVLIGFGLGVSTQKPGLETAWLDNAPWNVRGVHSYSYGEECCGDIITPLVDDPEVCNSENCIGFDFNGDGKAHPVYKRHCYRESAGQTGEPFIYETTCEGVTPAPWAKP